jgi:hypothetical protein
MAGAGSEGGSDDEEQRAANGEGTGDEFPGFKGFALRSDLLPSGVELLLVLLAESVHFGVAPAKPAGLDRGGENGDGNEDEGCDFHGMIPFSSWVE